MTVVWVVCVGIRRRKGAHLRAANAAGCAERAARRATLDDDLAAAEQDRRGAVRLEAEPEGVAVHLRGAAGHVQAAVDSAGGAESEQRLLDVGVEARLLKAGAVLPRENDHGTVSAALLGERQCLRRSRRDLSVEIYPASGSHSKRRVFHLGRGALRLQMLLRRCRGDERDGQ